MASAPILRWESERDPEFAQWVTHFAGSERIRSCMQCGLCSASCPLAPYMDYTPRRLMHMAREGFKKDVLSSLTIWLCTSCYACMVECPRAIRASEIMYALKRRAIQEGAYPRGFAIPVLAQEFTRMVRRTGRVTEIRLVLRVFLRTSRWRLLGMWRLGLRLLRTGRFRLRAESVERRKEIAALLDAVEAGRKELAA